MFEIFSEQNVYFLNKMHVNGQLSEKSLSVQNLYT